MQICASTLQKKILSHYNQITMGNFQSFDYFIISKLKFDKLINLINHNLTWWIAVTEQWIGSKYHAKIHCKTACFSPYYVVYGSTVFVPVPQNFIHLKSRNKWTWTESSA